MATSTILIVRSSSLVDACGAGKGWNNIVQSSEGNIVSMYSGASNFSTVVEIVR